MRKPYSALMSAIFLKDMTCKDVAACIGMSPQAFSRKMQRKSSFTASEIAAIGKILSIPEEDYFRVFIKPAAAKKERSP